MSESVWGVLTRAADRLTELAAHWDGYVQGYEDQDPMPGGGRRWDSPLDMWLYDTVDRNGARDPREWIAVVSPVVAAPLAEWLRASHARAEQQARDVSSALFWGVFWSEHKHAVEFARLVLGEAER